jgi:hypothetical protein
MNSSQHIPATPPSDGDDVLDPRAAADLLAQTERSARRQFSHDWPLVTVFQALVVLVVYGAIWFSVRGQHPYRGPSLSVIGFVYIITAVGALTGVAAYRRVVHGVRGPSRREDKISAIPFAVSLVSFYVFLGALHYDGFSNAVVYGVVDAAGPWLVAGAVLAGLAAAREDWWKLVGSLAMVICGTAAAFAGPIDVWGVLAVLGCGILLVKAGLQVSWIRRS